MLNAVLLISACGGRTMLPQCTFAAGLSDHDAAQPACTAARALVQCGSSGMVEVCLSAAPDSCTGTPSSECQDTCAANEYAVSCGGQGASALNGTPPSGCHSKGVTPGGNEFFCCPCL